MTSYAPPLSLPPIFNPSLFSNETTAVVNSSAPPEDIYVLFPEPQGAITFIDSGNQVEIGALKLSLLQDVGIVPNGVEMNSVGIAYDSGSGAVQSVSWDNLATKVAAVQALSQAPDATTLAVNNAISIQNGETAGVPTQKIVISADATGNRLALDGDYGTPGLVLTSGGNAGDLYWGSNTEPGSVGTLADVLTNGAVANMAIDMNLHALDNISALSISTPPVATPVLDFTRTSIPIVVDGVTYYIGLFTVPP
jgi:hypothetical protein